MTVQRLVGLLTARLEHLERLRATAEQQGDVSQVVQIETELAETRYTLDRIRTLPQ